MADRHEYPDALSDGPVRGRSTQVNPANQFERVRLHVLGEHLDDQIARGTDVRPLLRHAATEVSPAPPTVLNRIDPLKSPDVLANVTIQRSIIANAGMAQWRIRFANYSRSLPDGTAWNALHRPSRTEPL